MDINQLLEEISLEEIVETLKTELIQGRNLKEILEIDNAFLERVYAVAYTHYQNAQYAKALSLFDFLTQIDTKSYKYVLGLASSYLVVKRYQEASLAFFWAHTLEPQNPYPLFYMSECLIHEGHSKEALEALDQTIFLAKKNPQYKALIEKIQIIKNNLKLNK